MSILMMFVYLRIMHKALFFLRKHHVNPPLAGRISKTVKRK